MEKRLKVFLASSAELKEDRDRFRIFISEQNDRLTHRGIYIEVVVWENFLNAISLEGLQREYNKQVQECDVFLMLYFTKVGKYTWEEFDAAFQAFKEKGKPQIFTYFKDGKVSMDDLQREQMTSLFDFQTRLKDLGHYPTVYKNTEDLLHQFRGQLDRILEEWEKDFQFENPVTSTPTPAQMPVVNPAQLYNGENILHLLENALDPTEFETLCDLHFPKVAKKFASGQTQGQRVLWLWQHAKRYDEVNELLSEVKKVNPKAYDKYGPYVQ